MTRYLFNWFYSGSTLIEADSLDEAQEKFDELTIRDTGMVIIEDGEEFTQHEVLTETAPGVFDECEPGAGRPSV